MSDDVERGFDISQRSLLPQSIFYLGKKINHALIIHLKFSHRFDQAAYHPNNDLFEFCSSGLEALYAATADFRKL